MVKMEIAACYATVANKSRGAKDKDGEKIRIYVSKNIYFFFF